METVSDVGMEPDLTLDDNEAYSGMIKGYVFFFDFIRRLIFQQTNYLISIHTKIKTI